MEKSREIYARLCFRTVCGCLVGKLSGWWVGWLLCTQTSAENLENCLLFTFCTQRLVEKQPAVSIMRER